MDEFYLIGSGKSSLATKLLTLILMQEHISFYLIMALLLLHHIFYIYSQFQSTFFAQKFILILSIFDLQHYLMPIKGIYSLDFHGPNATYLFLHHPCICICMHDHHLAGIIAYYLSPTA